MLLTASPLASYHFDEGSGTTAADSSGNGNTATLFGTASFEHYDVGMTTGAAGSDLATGGAGGADVGNPTLLNITGQITVSAWVKMNSAGSGIQSIVTHGYSNSPAGEVFLGTANGSYEVGSWDGTDHMITAPVPQSDIGHWVHIAETYDGSRWNFYRNGHFVISSAGTVGAVAVNADWIVGASAVAGDRRYFDGSIDDVKIYNVALSEADIQQAMEYQPPALNVDTSAPAAEGQPYTLNLSATYPAGIPNTVSSWTLDWGDGSGVATATGSAASLSHTYATPGEYVLVATATDAQGVHKSDAAELDASFGDGGIAATPMPAGSSLSSLTLQYGFGSPAMVYFVSAGTAGSDMTLVRNTFFGGLETSFGSGGIASAHLDGYTLHGEGIAIDDQNRILLSGYATPTAGGMDQFVLARFNFDGTLDSTFGSGGIATLGAAGHDDLAYCVLPYTDSQGGSKILLAGQDNGQIALIQYTDAGALDSSFGSGGYIIPGGVGHTPYTLMRLDSGKFLVGGFSWTEQTSTDYAALRYNADGTLDTTFAVDGAAVADFSDSDISDNLAVSPNGKLLLTGRVEQSPGSGVYDMAMAQFTADGQVDTSFGVNGRVQEYWGSVGWSYEGQFQADGKILVSGMAAGATKS